MAYIPWWQRMSPPTFAERFDLGGLAGRRSWGIGDRVGLKPGGIVEPGVTHYAILTEAEKRANVKTWEKNTGLNFEDVEKKQQYKIRAGDIIGVGSGKKIKWTPEHLANYKKWIKLYSLEEYNKLHPDSQRHIREGLPVKAVETRGKNLNKFFTQEIAKANAGEKFVSQKEILQKAYKEFNLKKINSSTYPILTTLETRADKIDKALKNMLMETKPLKNFWQDAILKRTGLSNITLQRTLNSGKVKTYNVLADQGAALIRQSIPKSRGVYDFIKNLSFSDQLSKALEIKKGQPMLTGIDISAGRSSAPKFKVMQFAFRSWNQNQGQGAIKLFDKKGNLIRWDFGKKLLMGDITFEYKGKKYNTKNLSDPSVVKKDFPEVYKVQTELNKFARQEIDNPFKKPFVMDKVTYKQGDKITVKKLVKKIQVDGYRWSPVTGTLDILHGSEGVKNKPFTDLIFNTKDINQLEQVLERKLTSKKITKSQYNKAIKILREQPIISRITSQAKYIQKGHSLELKKLLSVQDNNKLSSTIQSIMQKKNSGLNIADIAKWGSAELSALDDIAGKLPSKALSVLGKLLKTAGIAAIPLDALPFTEAHSKGLTPDVGAMNLAEIYTNLPGTIWEAGEWVASKVQGKEHEWKPFYEATFGREYETKKLQETPLPVLEKRIDRWATDMAPAEEFDKISSYLDRRGIPGITDENMQLQQYEADLLERVRKEKALADQKKKEERLTGVDKYILSNLDV
jgi:hypothetical protein